MLTGNADQKTAMDAVNEGHVFRFLTKPCPPETLAKAIKAGLEQHRLVTAERELLERTLNGSVKLLTDTLALTDAAAFGRAQKLRDSMRDFARHFNITQTWDLELAAMLSPIGYLALPAAVLQRAREGLTLSGQEKDMLARVPEIGANLLANIPRLETIASIVRYQLQNYDGSGHPSDGVSGDNLPIGARILKVLNDLLSFEERKTPRFRALEAMRQCEGVYDTKVLDAVAAFHDLAIVQEIAEQEPPRAITLKELRVHDRLASGILTLDGTLIVAAETILTQMHMEKIRNFAELSGIQEPIYVAG
jgi:response regulator RpfG family c-di-GMP phosphodiesterase